MISVEERQGEGSELTRNFDERLCSSAYAAPRRSPGSLQPHSVKKLVSTAFPEAAAAKSARDIPRMR